MQSKAARPVEHNFVQEELCRYRVERQFFSQRRPEELVRDLLRAHLGQ